MSTGTRIPTITWTFGKRLEAARKLAGISQDQMAEELTKRGIKKGHAAVNRWEHDQTQPRDLFTLVEAWSEITDVDELWLLKGEQFSKRGNSTRSSRRGRGVTRGATRPGPSRPGGNPQPAPDEERGRLPIAAGGAEHPGYERAS